MTRKLFSRAGPWPTPALGGAAIGLVWSGILTIRTAVVAGVMIEILLWVTVLGRVGAGLRRFRAARTAGVDVWKAAEDGLAQLVPRSVARLMMLEPRMWLCLVRWITGRHEGQRTHAYGYHQQIRLLLAVVIGLVVVEGVVVDTILGLVLPGSAWFWVAAGLHLYGIAWLSGLWASFATRPHLVTNQALLLRDGVFTELAIPYAAITTARLARRSNLGRSGFQHDSRRGEAILAVGDATVELGLDPAASLLLNGEPWCVGITRLAISADQPHDLVRSVAAHSMADTPRYQERTG